MRNIANYDVRTAAKKAGVFLWQIAQILEISEPTMTRRLRLEMSESEKREYFAAIEKIAADRERGVENG